MNVPSKLAGFRRSLVISIQSPWSPADLWNSTLTRHSEISEISSWSCRREIGNWIVTGFKKRTLCEQIIRNMGPINTSCPSNSSFWTSCTCWIGMLRKTEFYQSSDTPGLNDKYFVYWQYTVLFPISWSDEGDHQKSIRKHFSDSQTIIMACNWEHCLRRANNLTLTRLLMNIWKRFCPVSCIPAAQI